MAQELVDSTPTYVGVVSGIEVFDQKLCPPKPARESEKASCDTKQERWWDHVFCALNHEAWVNQESFLPGGGLFPKVNHVPIQEKEDANHLLIYYSHYYQCSSRRHQQGHSAYRLFVVLFLSAAGDRKRTARCFRDQNGGYLGTCVRNDVEHCQCHEL